MDTNIFRKVALERLSSPEQLDQTLQVTGARTWIGVMAIFIILATFAVWGFRGSIPSESGGQGVLVRKGGVLNVVSRGSGMIRDLKIRVGERVKSDQVIATIAQPVLEERIRSMRQAYAEAFAENERTLNSHKSSSRLQLEALDRQRSNLTSQAAQLSDQAKTVVEQIDADEQLLAKGLITKQQSLSSKQRLISIQDQISGLNIQLKQLDAQEFSFKSQPEEDSMAARNRLSSMGRDVAALEQELSLAANVVSPYGGQVLELKVYQGGNVGTGEPIISIQPDEPNLELLAYLPSSQAKDIKVGMEAQISPSMVKREEFGFLRGSVVSVADYPATEAALMHNFENESLVRVMSGSAPVTEVRVKPKADGKTASGFQWSTSRGPDILLSSGTLCSVQIITRRQQPITLLFPYLKDKFGLK